MAASKSGDSGPGWVLFHVLGSFLALLALLSPAECTPPASAASAPATPAAPAVAPTTRVRRSDDYDNMDNFLMGSSDYDNFFLKSAKSVPRIGRRSGAEDEGEDDSETPVHVDRRSADTNALVPSGGYDHFFLKASKSVPRIGKRNDEYFMKTAKSVPRIGRRGGQQQQQHAGRFRRNKLPVTERQLERLFDEVPDLDKLQSTGPRYKDVTPFSRVRRAHQIEEDNTLGRDFPGGNDAILGKPHRLQRRNDDFMAAKSVPRMGKRLHPALVMQTEVGDLMSTGQWPWFRQQDSSPTPHKRSYPVGLLNLEDLPWESVDALMRSLKGGRIEDGTLAADDNLPDIIVLDEPGNAENTRRAAWLYSTDNTPTDRSKATTGNNNNNNNSNNNGSKELEEVRFQPDV